MNFGFLVFPGLEELDLVGPWEMISLWSRSLQGPETCQERVVHDGNIWTAAGVSAGIDLALAFIESVAGETVAGKVQFGTEYYPSHRFFGAFHQSPQAPAYLKKS